MLDIKVGDKVTSNGTKHSPKGLLGYVTRVEEGFDIEDHGTVEIIVTKLSGPAIWQAVVLDYAVGVLGLKLQPERIWEDGKTIPASWSKKP